MLIDYVMVCIQRLLTRLDAEPILLNDNEQGVRKKKAEYHLQAQALCRFFNKVAE